MASKADAAAAGATSSVQTLAVPTDQAKRTPVRRRSASNDGEVGDVMQEVWDTLEKDSDGTVSRKCFIDNLR